eukprot:s2586_g10.t2
MLVQEVTKEVVRPIYEVTEKIVEVPHTLVQERIEEVPKVEFVPLVKQVPKTQVREVQKQVGVPHYQARERIVEVPTTMVAEQMVEVPQVQIEELLKEVPRPEVKVVAKPVEKPVNEYVERIVEVPHTTIQECIIEVPKVEVQEIVKQVPRPEVQVVDRQVEKLEVQYVEKLVEKIIEVPTVEVREVIKQVSKPEEPALHSQSMVWLTTEHEMEMQAFVHQHLLSMLSPFSQHLKDLKDELEALRSEMEKKSEQLKHTNTVVKYQSSKTSAGQHGHELMTLTLDVNQAHTEVGNLRKELLPEIEKKIDEKTVELEFTKVYEELQVGKSNLEAYNTVHSKLESDLRELADFSRIDLAESTASNLAEKVGELNGLRESNDFLSQCYAGICGRVEQAKRVADDTHEAFKKFQHSASNQLDDIKKSCLPRISSKIESLETRIHRIVKDAAMDVEDLQQAKLQIESIKDALSIMDESIQLQDHTGRVADLSTLLDAKTANIRTNSSAIRSLEASLNSTNSELRRTTARVSEQNIVQDRLVEQARVAETEIHGLFDFRKESIPKLQDGPRADQGLTEHDAGLARFELRLQSVDRDIQNHTKHLTDINSEVVNVQADLKVGSDHLASPDSRGRLSAVSGGSGLGSESAPETGQVPNQLALLVPTFDPSTDSVEIWSSKELLKNDTAAVKRVVELVGGTWGAIPLEKKFELVEKALYRSNQKSDETSDSFLSRTDVIWTELLAKGTSLAEIQSYVILRGSRLNADDKKRVIVESGAEQGGALELTKVRAAIRMLGSGFFQDMTGSKREKGLRTYDHTAFTMDEITEEETQEAFWVQDELDDNTLEALAAEDDEDAALVLQFEDAISETIQNDQEMCAFYSTYQEARKRLSEKATMTKNQWSRHRGFAPEMLVFGRSARISGSVISDESHAAHHMALQDLPDGQRFREELATRERARKAFAMVDNDQAMRRAIVGRSRPNRGQYAEGDWVMRWSKKGEADGVWVGITSNPVEIPIPDGDSDDELFAESHDCFALTTDECWKLEIDVTQKDIDKWKREEVPSHMAFVATAAKRQRSEVKLSQLSADERQLFQQAKCKEIDSWLSTDTVMRVLRHQIPESNVLRCRWILTWKPVDSSELQNNPNQAKHTPKARLVVLGYEDPLIHEIPRDSPTMTKLTRMFILQTAASRRWSIESFDIRTAFLRGSETSARVLGLEPPQEMRDRMKLKPQEILQLLKGAYGRVDAPYLWFQELKAGLEKVGFVSSPFDPCAFLLPHPVTKKTEGLLGVHVDDGLCCGSAYFQEKLREVAKRFPFGSHKKHQFTFTGLRIHQQEDYSIHVEQTQYIKDIHPISLTRERRAQLESPVTEAERQSLRAVIGSLQYAAVNTRPDICSRLSWLQSEINRAKVGTLIEANRILHEAKSHADVKIVVKAIPNQDVRFVAFSDASFASAKNPSSHQGMMIMARNAAIGQNHKSDVSPLVWHSKKIQRVAVSTLSAEAMSLAGAVDVLSWMRLYWGWIQDVSIPWRQADQTLLKLPPAFAALMPEDSDDAFTPSSKVQEMLKNLPKTSDAIITTDCKSLYDLISRTTPPSCGEFRTQLQAKLIKEHLSSGIQIRWVPSGAQVADSLTKIMDNTMLRECLRIGRYCLHDEAEILKVRSDSRARLQWLRQSAEHMQG